MDPLTRIVVAWLAGLLIAPVLPGPTAAWALVAVGLGVMAGPGDGLAGIRGLAAAAAIGVLVFRSVPEGPRWRGPVALVGVREGASAGWTGDVRVSRWATPGAAWRAGSGGRVRVRFGGPAPGPGQTVILQGTAGPVRGALPGEPDPIRAAELVRIRTEIRSTHAEIVDPPARRGPEHDPTGLLRAVALGDRSGVDKADVAVLRRTGTAHLLAISGFHVGVVAAAVTGAATLGLRAVALWLPSGLPSAGPATLGVAAAWAYAMGAGAPLSAQRAAGLLLLVALGRSAGRSVTPVPLLALVAAGIAVVDPGALATPSLQLSFGAVLGLVLAGSRLSRLLPPDLPRAVRWTAQSLIATISSTLGTLPAAAWWFQSVSPTSPLANLVALPTFGFGIVPLAAAATWGPRPLSVWAGSVGSWLARGLLDGLAPLAVDPWTPAVGPLGAIGLAAVLLWGLRNPLGAGAVLAAGLGWAPGPPRGTRFTFLDVGQGDAALVEHADGTRWLIDGGPSRASVLRWLRRRGIRHIDVVVATHPERDHTGGLLAVVSELSVGAVWMSDPPPDLVQAAQDRDVPHGPPIDALWPLEPGWRGNNGSVVLELGPALLTGDIEATAEAALTVDMQPHALLKVPHHGAATSSTAAFLDAVSPTLAVISVGAGNRYGHPDDAVMERLAATGATVLRTDIHGTVTVLSDGGDLSVWTQR